MRYEFEAYIELPRAENVIQPASLDTYERRNWWAQVKKNGTASTIYVPPAGTRMPFAKTRHPDQPEHRAWKFTDASVKAFTNVAGPRWNVFCAELMHSKGNGIRDTNYVYDVLVYDGHYMVGHSFEERQRYLEKIFKVTSLKGPESHVVVNENTWVARNFKGGFSAQFNRICANVSTEDEGLVLKNPKGALAMRSKDNSSWMVKCRRPHSNYQF